MLFDRPRHDNGFTVIQTNAFLRFPRKHISVGIFECVNIHLFCSVPSERSLIPRSRTDIRAFEIDLATDLPDVFADSLFRFYSRRFRLFAGFALGALGVDFCLLRFPFCFPFCVEFFLILGGAFNPLAYDLSFAVALPTHAAVKRGKNGLIITNGYRIVTFAAASVAYNFAFVVLATVSIDFDQSRFHAYILSSLRAVLPPPSSFLFT